VYIFNGWLLEQIVDVVLLFDFAAFLWNVVVTIQPNSLSWFGFLRHDFYFYFVGTKARGATLVDEDL
jgi:hypothetical protein